MKQRKMNRKALSRTAKKPKKGKRQPTISQASGNGKVIELGKYVISDPRICHGHLTFKGTRVMVGPVLAALAEGRGKKDILRSWQRLTWPAVQEAQLLAAHRLMFDFPGGESLWLMHLEDAKAESMRKNKT
jgi:uncharacterized protein (DUF433 family)